MHSRMRAIVGLGGRLVGRQAGNVSQAEIIAGWQRCCLLGVVMVGRGAKGCLGVWLYVCLCVCLIV